MGLAACRAVVVSGTSVLVDADRVALVPPGEWPAGSLATFLGAVDGTDVVAVAVPEGWKRADGVATRWTPLREIADHHTEGDADHARDRELAVTAVAMTTWHDRNPACSLCGTATEPREAGWVRACPKDGRDHYPRTDPAVIVAITDDDDRMLLAHVTYHSPRRYSHLAGYLEPGESLEQAVHREAWEEARITLRDLEYVGSQPWPFPASVMAAFRAKAATTAITVDGVEVEDARFFTREDVAAQVADGTIVLAPPGSIARNLIHHWYGGEVEPGPDVRKA